MNVLVAVFVLSLSSFSLASVFNEGCNDYVEVTTIPFTYEGNITDAAKTKSKCNQYDPNYNHPAHGRWFKMIGTGASIYASTCDLDLPYSIIDVQTTCKYRTAECVSQSGWSGQGCPNDQGTVAGFVSERGTSYWIRISGYHEYPYGNFKLSITEDFGYACKHSTTIDTVPYSFTGDIASTPKGTSPCSGITDFPRPTFSGYRFLWNGTGYMKAWACSDDFDTLLQVQNMCDVFAQCVTRGNKGLKGRCSRISLGNTTPGFYYYLLAGPYDTSVKSGNITFTFEYQ